MTWRIEHGDCIEVMRSLPDASVDCCVTSPPYWGLRDYGHERQIGLEATPEQYVARMVEVFREVRRVLRADGTCWLNLGDSYNSGIEPGRNDSGRKIERPDGSSAPPSSKAQMSSRGNVRTVGGLKPKDLVGIPWRVAFALQADGWWLRQDIIWHKPNPMPESVRDRCTKAHEYVFLLTKSARYWWDAEAMKEPALQPFGSPSFVAQHKQSALGRSLDTSTLGSNYGAEHRNRRSVWTITTQPFSGAHFATMPPKLAELCILAGCKPGGAVLDPFAGAGTTGLVADRLGRSFVGCELNEDYVGIARQRIASDAPLFAGGGA